MALVARRTGPRRRMMADINVVPYVDVMLVLVVILMVAAPFVNPSVVDLPSVAKAGQQRDTPVRVVIRSDGRVSILEAGKVETPVASGQLIASVKARQKSVATPVVIEADAKVQYKSVVDVMRDLQKAGIERVGLSVQLAQ
ncbi:MAG TPA: biopolymer transporter ExbD [Burkholderiaceae bacterium]|nr:biopolymer transporter ExbD [Burkholderiaceae bacterium]